MRIVIFGAGSIGCHVGGHWALAGLDVAFVGRDRIRADIARHGLTLSDESGMTGRLKAVRFLPAGEALAAADLVAVCVKAPATQAAARQIAAHAPAGATVLGLQNGISPADELRDLLPGRQVLRGVVGFNVAYRGDGRFHRGTAGELAVADAPVTRHLAARVAGTPGAVRPRADIDTVAWGKLLLNLNNAVNALSGETLRDELSQRDYRRVLAACQREALAVLGAAGIRPARLTALPPALLPAFVSLPDAIFNPVGLRLQKIDAHARSSMADDFSAGRPSEIDVMNGEIVRLGGQVGQATPVNAAIVRLVRQAEAGGRARWSGGDLVAEVMRS